MSEATITTNARGSSGPESLLESAASKSTSEEMSGCVHGRSQPDLGASHARDSLVVGSTSNTSEVLQARLGRFLQPM
jgi:hypothetical protein